MIEFMYHFGGIIGLIGALSKSLWWAALLALFIVLSVKLAKSKKL